MQIVKPTTPKGKTHIVSELSSSYTLCGVNINESKRLCSVVIGKKNEVSCKNCLKKYNKKN